MTPYVLEITANDRPQAARESPAQRADAEKTGFRARQGIGFFLKCAKHRLFSMLFSAPS
jgi:hypothetical protein